MGDPSDGDIKDMWKVVFGADMAPELIDVVTILVRLL